MHLNIKTNNGIFQLVIFILTCNFYAVADNCSYAVVAFSHCSQTHGVDSIFTDWAVEPAHVDSGYIRKIREKEENHRFIVVRPNADSHFWEIDSIISSVDYDTILSELCETVIAGYKNQAAWYLNEVVRNYKYFEVSKVGGNINLNLDLPELLVCKFDYAMEIKANDLPRRIDYTLPFPTDWNYVFEKDEKAYLFENLIKKEFHATNKTIKLPYDYDKNLELWKGRGTTIWTFPIRKGKIVGAFVTFHFGDVVVNPTIDLFSGRYVYPQYYLKKEAYEKLPYWVDPLERARQLKERCSFIAAALLPAFPCCLLPAAAIPLLRIDLGHCVSGQDCQALAEQRVPEGKIFASVEQMPQFPGGEAELLKYVSDHLVYPEEAKKNGIKGRVVIQFVVLADGAIGEVKVARGKSAELDKAAVEVVKNLPKFKPGLLNDRPVAVWYTLPVIFKLPQE